MRYRVATGNSVLRAYDRAVKENERLGKKVAGADEAHASSAGYIIPNGQKAGEREGYQVFVTIIRYREKLHREKPKSGGLRFEPIGHRND